MLIGIGAQKAGTTWLHDQLSRDPRVLMPIKEMHVFDTRYRPEIYPGGTQNVQARVSALEALPPHRRGRSYDADLALRRAHVRAMDDDNAYLSIFADRLQPQHQIFGEITPSYGTLGVEGLSAIGDLTDDVRIVFLMRDPVSRLISGVQQGFRLRKRIAGWADVRAALDSLGHMARTRYDQTLATLDATFRSDRVFLGFYETMFCTSFAERLGRFLDLPGLSLDPHATLNAAPDKIVLTTEQTNYLRQALQPIYDACEERFGNALPAAWRSDRLQQ